MKLSRGTKILIAAVLLVAAVAAWYTLYLQGTAETEAVAPPPARTTTQTPAKARTVTSASARALEILPLPFLVTKAPEEAPPPPAANKTPVVQKPPKEVVEAPPNPFVPLPERRKTVATTNTKTAERPAPTPTTTKPVTLKVTEAPELMQVPIPQIQPPPKTEPVLPPEARVSVGALPVRLQPLEREVAPLEAAGGAKAPAATTASGGNPLKAWAEAQGLRLAGIALGPVSVAIFATKDGYLALPVGERFPGTDIQLKAVTAERVLLVQGPYNLTLEYGGGG